jgi:hypothetical protein
MRGTTSKLSLVVAGAGVWALALSGCGGGDGGGDGGDGSGRPSGSAVLLGKRVVSHVSDPAVCRCPVPTPDAVRAPLACYCDDPTNAQLCAASLPSFTPTDSSTCRGDGPALLRVTGCGRVSFVEAGLVFEGVTPTFDQGSGKLIGLLRFSDIPVEACGTWTVLYGAGLFAREGAPSWVTASDLCPELQTCVFCGNGPTDVPPCT